MRWKIREKLRERQTESDERRTRFGECEKDKKVREVKGELGIERKKERNRRREEDRDRASQIKERVRFPAKGERGKRPGWES